MDIKNFYKHIKMCIYVVTIHQEYLLPIYQSIKWHSGFQKYVLPYYFHPLHSWGYIIFLVKTELNWDTALNLKNCYNHINMCLHVVTIIQEELLPDYQSIKRHYGFQKYFSSISFSPLIFLESTDIHFPWTLQFGGLDKLHVCQILHVTSSLQILRHPRSLNIGMDNYIQNPPCAISSYWRH